MTEAAPEAPAVVEADADAPTVVVVEPPEPEPEEADTTTVVVNEAPDAADPSDAVKEAAALDHESRITRLEDVAVFLGREVEARPTREEVQAMTPTREQVTEVATAAAEAVAAEDAAEEPEPGAGVRVEEPAGADPILGTVSPDTVPAEGGDAVANERPKVRHGIIKW